MFRIFILIVISFEFCCVHAQKGDSLRALLKAGKGDTTEGNICIQLGKIVFHSNPDSASMLFQKSLVIADRLHWKRGVAQALFQLGRVQELKGNNPGATKFYLDALALMQELNDKHNAALLCYGIGYVYLKEALYAKAHEFNFRALKLYEELHDSTSMISIYTNIGAVYIEQKEYPKARNYFESSLSLSERMGNKEDMGNNYGSLGTSYYYEGNFEKTLEYYFRAYNLFMQIGQEGRAAIVLMNIGAPYCDMAKAARERNNQKESAEFYGKARDNYERALSIFTRLDDKYNLAICEGNLGSLFLQIHEYDKAEPYLLRSRKLAVELDSPDDIRVAEENLSKLYEETGRYALSLTHYKAFVAMRDSIFNEENTKRSVRAEMNYEFEKKEAAAKLEQEKKDAVAAAEKRRQQIILWAISGFGVLVFGFALFAYRSFLQKKRANFEISRQKDLIEEKQREILDSIYYARRIQRSLLPSERAIARMLKR